MTDCNEAIRTYRNLAAAYLNRGNVYLSKSDVEHALADFNEALRLDPKNAWGFATRGNLYKGKGDFDRALTDLNEAIQLDPGYALAFFSRGELYKDKGDLARAHVRHERHPAARSQLCAWRTSSAARSPTCSAMRRRRWKISARRSGSTPMNHRPISTAASLITSSEAAIRTRSPTSRRPLELNPKDAYAALWLDLAERRNSSPNHLAETAKQLDMTVWPAPVVRHFLDQLNIEQTYGAAFDTDPKTKTAQTCEANFYSGELALAKKNKKEAQRLLKLAADQCPPGFIEIDGGGRRGASVEVTSANRTASRRTIAPCAR